APCHSALLVQPPKPFALLCVEDVFLYKLPDSFSGFHVFRTTGYLGRIYKSDHRFRLWPPILARVMRFVPHASVTVETLGDGDVCNPDCNVSSLANQLSISRHNSSLIK